MFAKPEVEKNMLQRKESKMDNDSKNEKTISRDDFTSRFQLAIGSLDMNTQELADLLDTTSSTINRWKTGQNVPTRSLRTLILNGLAKAEREKKYNVCQT